MRKIKFRAWDKKLKRWDLETPASIDEICFWQPDKFSFKKGEMQWSQFTGLKDKNGKEIYEGDIIRYRDYLKVVVFDEDNAHFSPIGTGSSCDDCYDGPKQMMRDEFGKSVKGLWDCEVVGNVYENPEILNEK